DVQRGVDTAGQRLRVFAHLSRQPLQPLPLRGKHLWRTRVGEPALAQTQHPTLCIVDRASHPDGDPSGLPCPQSKPHILELKMAPAKGDTRLCPQATHEGYTFLKDTETVREVDTTGGEFTRNGLIIRGYSEAENEASL